MLFLGVPERSLKSHFEICTWVGASQSTDLMKRKKAVMVKIWRFHRVCRLRCPGLIFSSGPAFFYRSYRLFWCEGPNLFSLWQHSFVPKCRSTRMDVKQHRRVCFLKLRFPSGNPTPESNFLFSEIKTWIVFLKLINYVIFTFVDFILVMA